MADNADDKLRPSPPKRGHDSELEKAFEAVRQMRKTTHYRTLSPMPPPGSVSLLARIAIWMVRQYQRWLSPLLGQHCRFHPSCSRYYVGAVMKYGFWRGSIRGFWRLLRCNPFCQGGVDLP